MPKAIKAAIQYIVLLLFTAGLLWLSLRGITVAEGENKFEFIWKAWQQAHKGWLLMMAVIAYISHFQRAERWRMLLEPSGNKGTLMNSFYSLMVGYMVNLAIPRGGEVSRCYNLYKLENAPVEVSFGTVIVERIVDVLCLLFVIFLAFIVEWDRLMDFIDSLGIGKGSGGLHVPPWAIFAVVAVVALVGLVFLFRKNERLRRVVRGFREGLTSIFKLEKKTLFVGHSVSIWILYFFMSFCVVKAFDTTSHLGMNAVLTLFALGAIAMAAPLPGGAGSYHTIVPLGLVTLYHLDRTDAVAFVFIFHAWQTLTMIVGGVISLIITTLILRWKNPQTK
ncbi:MAG: flippase-like domain-containing protein [Bacteroidetes bacterium]|nr:flippase-like domain-containing protein [Bacteroidota bacterium]